MRFLLERRAMRFSLAAGVLCTLLVPTAAHAFCRTTTQPLPANYSPSRGCFTDGLLLFWRNACVTYSINQSASRNIPFEDAQRVIDASFETWNTSTCADGSQPGIAVSNHGAAACADIRYNPEGPNQNLIVFRDDGWPYDDPNSTLGLTTVTFNADTGEIFDADMEINSSGRNLSVTDRVPSNGFDLASVVTHEAGHFLGLAHATDPKSTMFASYKPGTVALRTLAVDDIAGLCAIYPDRSTRIVSASVSTNRTVVADACNPNPRHGFTAECAEQKEKPGDCCASAPKKAAASWGELGGITTAIAGIFMVRRHRRRRG
jgi:hypothetical protein